MAVGNTINVSIPVIGTTVFGATRSDGNRFVGAQTLASVAYPVTIDIRPAAPLGKASRFGLTYKVRPADSDNPGSQTKGSVSIAINVDSVRGSSMSSTDLANCVRYALSAMLKASLIEDLSSGTAL